MADVSPAEGDSAVFAPRSVRGPGVRPANVAAVLAVALGGLVLISLLQPAAEPADGAAQAFELPAQPGPSEPAGTRPSARPQARPAPSGALLLLDVQRDGRHLFVHGEVYTNRVTVVIVSLRDADGRTVDTRTVSLPGGSTAFRLGAVDRFDVRFDDPDLMATGHVTIRASGYDAGDDRIASVQVVAGVAAR